MSEQPEEMMGFGLAELKVEGSADEYLAYCIANYRKPPWWPRRKLAQGLERLANWVCRDRDEGW